MSDLKRQISVLVEDIKRIVPENFVMMEVCGTHTMNIAKFGLRSLLPKNIRIISGPGCPVCVTSSSDIKTALDVCKIPNTIIATFGDMVKVPCDGDSLQNYKNVKIVYSPMEALDLAEKNKDKEIVLLAVGFETTTPLTAVVIKEAEKRKLNNFSVLCMHKLVPQAMELIIKSNNIKLNSFLLPGHVAVITGSDYFNFITEFKFSGVIAGFEPLNITSSIKELVKCFVDSRYGVVNNYSSIVKKDGNVKAQNIVKEVYVQSDSFWRGIGLIKSSGLKINKEYLKYDALNKFNISVKEVKDPKNCRCGDILKGEALPADCLYYGKDCTPSNPIGPCMVSTEGTCAAFYKYVEE